VVPLATQISNWNATNVTVTPGQWETESGAGRGGGYWLSTSPSTGGSGSVIWQFAVVPGRQYQVAATWPGDPKQASNARFTIMETEGEGQGYFPLAEVRVDQRVVPSQITDADNVGWLVLGNVTPIRTTLLVAVNDDSDFPAVGDAVWVEDITPPDLSTPVMIMPPMSTLLDFGCMVGLDAEFDSSMHVVYLHGIMRIGDRFWFDFRSDAPGLLGHALIFTRTLGDVEYTTDYVEASPLSAPAEPLDAPQGSQGLLWQGFLVTGLLDDLAAVMPTDGAMTATTGPQVEPALVQNLGRSYVRTINLANQDRTHATPPAGCPGSDDTGADYPYVIAATNLTGDLRFREGYNVAIRQSARNNSLTFLSVQGAGAGAPCNEVPVYPGEQPPSDSSLLTGGPACDEVVNSINGLASNLIYLAAGLGVLITIPSDAANTLTVDMNRHDMTVCGPVQVVFEELPDE